LAIKAEKLIPFEKGVFDIIAQAYAFEVNN